MAPSRPTTPGRGGAWEPLPAIVYGYAVHPLSPSHRDTRISSRPRLSTVTASSAAESFIHRDVVSLEVGDEVYAFEKYTPRGKETEGEWYRGYVVCTTRRPTVTWNASASDPSSSKGPKLEEPQQVFIGIFPASHIHRRDELPDAEGRLAVVAAAFQNGATLEGFRPRNMEPLKEEEEENAMVSRKSFKLGPPPEQANSSRAGLPVYPPSIRSASPTESQMLNKPLPPRPSLKPGDETESGALQPIVDEIASALREWHMLMFQYLARRDYKLFQIVREHIEVLHLGRRQLLAQTLSSEETASLRRDCVTRLVSGNIVQGLDVIVRHPEGGGLVTVDIEGEVDVRNWMSTVRMYALQACLAYTDVGQDYPRPTALRHQSSLDNLSVAPLPTPAHSAFPEFSRSKNSLPLRSSPSTPSLTKSTSAQFYHVYLDVRAFVASPCAPGETAELYFSLYNRNESRFITEDFCAILNHNGVLARDPTTRIRTLFTDLAQSDVESPVYLVCRIVRNGALKMGSSTAFSFAVDTPRRGSSSSSVFKELSDGEATPTALSTSPRPVTAGSQDNVAAFRRPFGCAVLEITQLGKIFSGSQETFATREYAMPIFQPVNEAIFSMLHQDIIAGNEREFEKSSRAESIAVSVKVFHGNVDKIVKENASLLQDAPLTLRLGFPDVVFPGDVRNELYVKLWSGDFTSARDKSVRGSVNPFGRGGGTISMNNIQVTVEVRDEQGNIVDQVISQGTGEANVSFFHSLVFARNVQPTFGELIKIILPPKGVPKWHLFFTFRQRSSRERPVNRGGGEVMDRPFAFAFLPLSSETHGFLEDGGHTLVLYKADRVNQLTPDLYLSSPYSVPPNQKVDQLEYSAEIWRVAPPMRDSLIIRSSLCSTRHTQNGVLLNLLHWNNLTHDKEWLSTVLVKFTFVGEVEIVKFLSDIFDALFGIIVSTLNSSGDMDSLVFHALVTVLGIVQDRRFSNFQPVLDIYIAEHFRYPLAHSHIINSMNRLLSNPTSSETAPQLRAALKVWVYIFKFITRSRELQKQKEANVGGGATADHLEMTFKRELKAHLTEVNRMMSTTSPASIIGTQTIAVRQFPTIIPELGKIFDRLDLCVVVTDFARSLAAERGKIIMEKLIMYLQIVKSCLFEHAQTRASLVETIVLWIKPHFGRYDEFVQTVSGDSDERKDAARIAWLERIRLCVSIIAVMLDRLQGFLVDPVVQGDRKQLRQEQDNVEFLLSLMPRLLESYREFQNPANEQAFERVRSAATTPASIPVIFPDSYPFSLVAQLPATAKSSFGFSAGEGQVLYSPAQGEIAIVLLSLVLSSPKKHLVNFFDSIFEIEGRENFTTLLTQLFKVTTSILNNEAWPKNWLNVNILAHKVLVKAMDAIAVLLQRSFIPAEGSDFAFDAELWKEGLSMLLKLLSSDQLLIEELSSQKRRAVWRLAGDIRGDGAAILLQLWDSLGWPEHISEEAGVVTRFGGFQNSLSSLVGAVVNLCVSHHDQLRNNAVQMLYSMIVSQYREHQHFDDIENELVNKLDSLFMSDSKGDDISRAFFITQLRLLFDSSAVDEQLRERISSFMDSVDRFLELLLNVRALPDGEEFADDRVIATLRLMNFIRRIGRNEMYIKYVHQLVNMQLQAQNYVEAALTLKLHSDLLTWDPTTFVEPMDDLGLPQQSQFHRKETLDLLIIDYMAKGKAWESALEICKELTQQHETVTFNYGRLAEIKRHEAMLLELIVTEQRYYPDYFRVAFYGNFPSAIRNKHFIYRGFDWEKFGAFCERILGKHPGARLLQQPGDPPVDIRFGGDQYIQCSTVSPEPNQTLAIFNNPDVPIAVRTYYEHSAISLFSSSRQIVKLDRDGNEELWLEKTYYTTEEAFPTLLRRSEIISSESLEISPVEIALQDVELKNKELDILNRRYSALAKTQQIISTNPLSMTLNSVVDAPLGSGVSSYRAAYLMPEYVERYPERVETVEKLRAAVDHQVRIIDSCLRLHALLCPPEMLGFHDTLEKFFRKNFSEEIHRLTFDGPAEMHPAVSGTRSRKPSEATPYQPAQHRPPASDAISIAPSAVSVPHARTPAYAIPPLPSRTSVLSTSTIGTLEQGGAPGLPLQTPLQKHLARLTRHGMGALDGGAHASDTTSLDSPSDSFVNGGGSGSGGTIVGIGVGGSGSSIVGSISGSLKGRFSRLGALSFGRGA